MDTEINYKYKDGLHPDIKEGHLTIDKSFYKYYLDLYNDTTNTLHDRLNHFGLRCWGDEFCRIKIQEMIDFFYNVYHDDSDEDYLKLIKVFDFLLNQEIVEFTFEMY